MHRCRSCAISVTLPCREQRRPHNILTCPLMSPFCPFLIPPSIFKQRHPSKPPLNNSIFSLDPFIYKVSGYDTVRPTWRGYPVRTRDSLIFRKMSNTRGFHVDFHYNPRSKKCSSPRRHDRTNSPFHLHSRIGPSRRYDSIKSCNVACDQE
jgi:hypothetical protein